MISTKVSSGALVKQVMTVAGLNKTNATNIFNLFSQAWHQDRVGFLKSVDDGIAVRKTRKATVKKTKVAGEKKEKTVATKKTEKTASPVGEVKKSKKLKLKTGKKIVAGATTDAKSTQATA